MRVSAHSRAFERERCVCCFYDRLSEKSAQRVNSTIVFRMLGPMTIALKTPSGPGNLLM
jgi:hypothetical protein